MAISDEIVGKEFGPFVYDYTFRDLEICALGCGCAADGETELEYVNEGDPLDPQLKVLPVFGVPLTVSEEISKALDYGGDWDSCIHYGYDIRFLAPFKMSDHIETYVTQTGLWDRGEGRGALSLQSAKACSADGTVVCTIDSWDIDTANGGWGGEKPPKDVVEMPEREPDAIVDETVPLNQALIYRLMGDYHQQHINWDFTKRSGLPRPILHGVSNSGISMRHVINTFIPGEPERLTRFKIRFTSPVLPGSRIRTEMWKVGENEIRFRMTDPDNPDAKPHMNYGIAEWK